MNKKHIIFSVIASIIFTMSANAQVFDLKSAKSSSYSINQTQPVVYKPSKLLIGTKTKFIIKADPESYVSLVTSDENRGAPEFHGHRLRLGEIINPHEAKVGSKGIVEIEIPMPQEKELVGKILFFEVLVWKNPNYSDMKVAKIMGINGQETDVNAVIIAEPPKNTSVPGIGATIPGTDFNINDAVDALNSSTKDFNNDDYYQGDIYYRNEPLMLRNLRTPEIKSETNK